MKEINTKSAIILLVILALVAIGFITFVNRMVSLVAGPPPTFPPVSSSTVSPTTTPSVVTTTTAVVTELKEFKKFASEGEFKAYLQESESLAVGGFGVGWGTPRTDIAIPMVGTEAAGALKEAPERVSGTTVQVFGIDEPDIVKTDGKEIYFSSRRGYLGGFRGLVEEKAIWPGEIGGVKVIKAFPPAELAEEVTIDKVGDLLLIDDVLVIFAGNETYGYDVSDPKLPVRRWTIEFQNSSYVVAARLYKEKIYLITRTRIQSVRPCPIKPLSVDGVPLEIACADIYHPTVNIPVDVTFTALKVEPSSGEVEGSISFVGSSGESIVYMSENAIYATYFYYGDFVKFTYDFYSEECKDIIPDWVREKLEKLMGYDISSSAKLTELRVILENFYDNLDNDEKMRIENELTNRMGDYYKENSRELEKTGIVKVNINSFNVESAGNVPGNLLNQFSLDEYQNHLRIATTIGGRRWGMFWDLGESANDVYVLDSNLEIVGSVKDLGLSERIYSVRFLQDKGYVVTFKQIDPFFVLDLSNPATPTVKGELKIPGYSSYLHPITKDKILGIGKESSKVKISLFDVQNPEKPTEAAKYVLEEYWSDILNTHHAFLLDKKHQIFFLPGSKGGYVFSYYGNELKLKKVVSNISARRAIYINDYLYVIGDDQITVLNELDWEKVNELEL